MPQPARKHRVFDTAPEEELLYSLAADGTRKHIDPVATHGRFWRVRLGIGWLLVVIFLGLPLLELGGGPGILLDLPHRQFHFFGTTFHPTDNLILLAFGAGVVALVFFVTSAFGRIWCGYACPQTVYLELLFRPIERLLEGKPAQRRKLNKAPWSAAKVGRKGAKWLVYGALALLLSATFVAYFVGWSPLVQGLSQAPGEHRGTIVAILFVTAMILVDFGYFRDQMCTIACPYGRLQTVLVDADTIVVAYDEKRGEPRGKPKTVDKDGKRGDCIACKRCIATCPTGMDIRRGLQLECIGCAQCIEACDEVMERLDRPRGLIRYTSTRQLEAGRTRFWRPRIFLYLAFLGVTWGALAYLAEGRASAQVELLRGGREAYRVLHTGQVANQLRLRITNQLDVAQSFTVELSAPPRAKLVVSADPLVVAGDQVATANVAVTLERSAFTRGQVEGRFIVRSDHGDQYEEEFVFLGPYRSGS